MRNFLKTFNILSDSEIEKLIQLSTTRKLNKSDYFIREGEICKEVAFVKSGTLRSFYISNAGEEITYCITFPDNLMTAYSSYISGQESPENIQALTTTELIIIPKKEMEELADSSYNWLRFLKAIAEQEYINLEKRIFRMQKEKAKQRYLDLMKHHPNYVQHIPLQYLASYLGITQRHLSRIRKEIIY